MRCFDRRGFDQPPRLFCNDIMMRIAASCVFRFTVTSVVIAPSVLSFLAKASTRQSIDE
jgi:hypothetical protein